ncbi:MAG: ABC transporter ATP-binding protein [Candidatus Omnitrophica bacterium]|nr:ABC transporter ATP-binding protein [Candidatus Omnitrophota bacterium]
MKNAKKFFLLLAPYKKQALLALCATLVTNLLGLAFPWAIKLIIDEILSAKNSALLNWVAAGLIIVFSLKFYFGFLREYLFALISENTVLDLRNKLYWHLQRLSVSYVENTPTGRIISGIIGDVESIRKFLFGGAIDFAYSFFTFFFVLSILFFINFKLTLISLIYLPAFSLVFLKLSPRLGQKQAFVRQKYAELTARLNEVFNGIRVVSGFAKEEYEAGWFDSKQKEIVKASLASERLGIFLWMMSEFFSSLGLVTLIWFGAKEVFLGRLSPGALMAFYSYLGMLFFPVIKMVVINNYYQEASAALARIDRVLAEEPGIKETAKTLRPSKIRGDIKFAGVSFAYDNRKAALSGINLEVKEAEVVALAGKSGSGKSTIINLLLRFYEPKEGAIYIDGYDLKELELKYYRSRVAMVLQDDYLFSGTVRENILYGNPGAGMAAVKAAARSANAEEFISSLPRGYDTEIGERGIKLSFGQRQRLSIARAILREPDILILDEATSCVDSETERLIIEEAFRKLMAGRTTFIISHRISSVIYADKIVFIEKGRIVESGSHLELLGQKGSYWRMWLEQTVR